MKTLVLHPEDNSTEFLTEIYSNLQGKTVIQGGISKSEVNGLIESHERIIMLGHGAPFGLMNPRRFPGAGFFIIDDITVSSLKNKSSCIYIWCHADQFVTRNGLFGLCSGMFISEMGEAELYGFHDIEQKMIDQSNKEFSSILSRHISEPLNVLYKSLMIEYETVARDNPIAMFNLKRSQLISEGTNYNPSNMLSTVNSLCTKMEDSRNGLR